MTRVWLVRFDKHGFLPSTLPLAILCRLGLHSWQAVETKTISEVYQGSTISVDPDFGAKRVHRWQCRRDFCAAEFGRNHSRNDKKLARYGVRKLGQRGW